MEFFGKIGSSVEGGLAYVGSLTSLAGRAAYFTFIGPFQGQPLRFQRAVSQAMEAGVRCIPILSLITFFIGLILALQAAYELRRFGAISFVASAVALSMTRELGPLITAVIVIGRSGSAFAAELGTMKVSEEIDALETMAINPVSFLVAPKFVAMILMLPCLTIWANFMGILGGSLFGDLPFELERLGRKLVVLCLEQIGVETAAVVDRLDRVGGDPQPHRTSKRVRYHRDVEQVGQKPALGFDVGVTDAVAHKRPLARQFAPPRHWQTSFKNALTRTRGDHKIIGISWSADV